MRYRVASKLAVGFDTLVPISAVGVLVTAAVWLWNLNLKVLEHDKNISGISTEVQKVKEDERKRWDSYGESLADIKSRTAAIDAKLSLLIEWSDPNRSEKKHAGR